MINKEELYQKYIVEKLSQRDVARFFGVTVQTIWNNCKKHGFARSPEENYAIGVKKAHEAWAENKEAIVSKMTEKMRAITAERGEEMRANRKRTMQERYGVDSVGNIPREFRSGKLQPNFHRPEVQLKAQNTLKEKYGSKGPLGNPTIRTKIYKTIGGSSPFCNPETREKAKSTLIRRYGVDNPFKSDAIQNNIKNTMIECGFVSQGEQDLFNFVKELCPDAKQGDYSTLRNRELDVYIPSKKIAIEYNGEYWHSDNRIAYDRNISRAEASNYHYTKYLDCKQRGIRLVHIWESEWLNKQDIWKRKLKSILNKNDTPIIYARQCMVKEITPDVKRNFLNKHHIQGNDHSNSNFGLFHNNELVAVMTFRKSRDNKEAELSRYATSCHIPGGFSKLFKHSGYKNVTSWSDNRLSLGNMYEQTGWGKIKETGPDYQVFHNKRIYHKSAFKRQNIKNKFPEYYSEQLTEWEMEDSIPNCFRIWDCGKIKWAHNS